MGEVYLASEPNAGAEVALKLIRADRAESVRALRRFTREVRAMARLDHPCIASVYDYGVHRDEDGVRRPFFVMERVEGRSLRDFLEERPSIDDALPVFDQVLSALAYAHARGVIHRDLKPENVLLGSQGHDGIPVVKILDFGIARMVDDDVLDEATVARIELGMSDDTGRGITDEMSTLEMRFSTAEISSMEAIVPPSDSHPTAELDELLDDELESWDETGASATVHDQPPSVAGRLTQLNQCVGTPAYLAPEQIRSKRHAVGPASDLYAVGIMLYELLCGKRPFRARTPRELLKMHLAKPLPEIKPLPNLEIPDGLRTLVRRLLSKHPSDRPTFAADVRRTLRAIASGRDVVPPAIPAVDARQPQKGSSPFNPALAKPGTSQLGEKTSETPSAPPARLAMGLLPFREAAFVGRATQRHELWQRFTDAHDSGSMQVVIVDGESGIGKTRLVRWLRERAEELGLARAFVAPYDAGPGGGGLRVAIERHLVCKGLDGEALQVRVQEGLRSLGLTDPWLTTAVCNFLRPGKSDGTLVSAAPDLGTTFALADSILRRFSSERPVIFHIDDAQEAADEATELVEFLLGQQVGAPYPALIVVSLRSELLLTDASLRQRVRRLAAHQSVSRITLEALDRADILALIQSLAPLDSATLSMLGDRAAGHPQFAIQLLNHWSEANELQPGASGDVLTRTSDQPVPSRINEVAERHVANFLESLERHGYRPALAEKVLSWMAIIGEPVNFPLLAALCKSEDIGPAQVDFVWESALVDGLCAEDPHEETLRFSHKIVRRQLLEQARVQPGFEKRLILCAEAKLRQVGQDPQQLHYEVAEHLFEASEPTRAWRHLVYSARCSLDLNQLRLARRRLRKALDLAHGRVELTVRGRRIARPSSTTIEVSADERFEARRAYVEACIRMNYLEDIGTELANLEAEAGGAPARQGWARLLEADLNSRRGEVEQASELYRDALAQFEDTGNDYSTARALRGLGDTLARAGRIPAGLEALERAEPIARRSGNENLLAEVLLSLGATHFDNGERDASERCLVEALKRFKRVSNLVGVGETHIQLGRGHLLVEHLDTAEQHFAAARRAHTLIGDRDGVVRALNGLGEVARAAGDFEQAETAYLQALEMIENSGDGEREADAVVRANLGLVLLNRGRHDEANTTLVSAARTFRKLGTRPTEAIVCGLLAANEVAKGNLSACRGWLDCIDALELPRPPADRDYAKHLMNASKQALELDDKELAGVLLSRARDAYGILGDEDEIALIESSMNELENVRA